MPRAGRTSVWLGAWSKASPTAWLTERFARWARRRQGQDRFPVTLHARRIYILPTRAGVGFAALLTAMLLAGLNYGNNVALFLTFTLGGFALVAMHQCHRNLLGLRVRAPAAPAVFAGEQLRLAIALENPGARTRLGLRAAISPAAATVPVDIAAGGAATLHLSLRTERRGPLPMQRIELASSAPFGLFRAWCWLHAVPDALVYAQPAGTRLPPQLAGALQGERTAGPGDDEWVDLRAFRQGDSPRQVAWKSYARGAPLLVREYRALGTQTLWFTLEPLHGAALEARLSQLTRWIADAAARGEHYGLQLPGQRIETGAGVQHRHRCLAALARYGLEP
jgi:uncharacterized protein (DUF58 family)